MSDSLLIQELVETRQKLLETRNILETTELQAGRFKAEAERLREALELLPFRLAEMLLASYRILAHDGRGLKGEHYWMEHTELAEIFKREQGRLAALSAEKPAETEEGT